MFVDTPREHHPPAGVSARRPARGRARPILRLASLALLAAAAVSACAGAPQRVSVRWRRTVRACRTTPTLQVVVNPLLRRGSPAHDRVFRALRNLKADYVRYVPWLPYPRLAVAELKPPALGATSWDFSLIDPLTLDFLRATDGHPVIVNFSTIPEWMFETPKPVPYPQDPDQVTWTYEQGMELRDPGMKQLGDYYARLVSWYTRGGFRDELGQWHRSGHHFKIDYWEVLNEVDSEHSTSPQQYTAWYDAIVAAIRRVAPRMKFVGLALASPGSGKGFFEYFLDRRNHRPGAPLDMISYHFYANVNPKQAPEAQDRAVFGQADHFLDTVRSVEAIRRRLSPRTRTTIDEIGAMLPEGPPIPDRYWNLSGAMYAYLYARLARLGIDVAGESQLVGYPTQFPSVSMVDWNTGQPNARFWVLKLLRESFGPGDGLVATQTDPPSIFAQGFRTRHGKRRLLMVNERDEPVDVEIQGAKGGRVRYVDETTGFHPPASASLKGDRVELRGLAVAVVTLP